MKRVFKTFSLRCYVALLRTWRRRSFHAINAMILMPQIFDVTANENARYKRNELESPIPTGNSENSKAATQNATKTFDYWRTLIIRVMLFSWGHHYVYIHVTVLLAIFHIFFYNPYIKNHRRRIHFCVSLLSRIYVNKVIKKCFTVYNVCRLTSSCR